MKEERRKPWRMESVSYRLSDEYNDILEAEFNEDSRERMRHGIELPQDKGEPRFYYDESQSVEVLSVNPGWLHGERFYVLNPPGFEGEDEFCFIQDFGFGPYLKKSSDPFFWRSIAEDEPETRKNTSDLLSPDFFLAYGESAK